MSKISSRPPVKNTQQENLHDQFIKEGTVSQPKSEEQRSFPWLDSHVRDDVIKQLSIRFPETYFLKLEYLSKETRRSKHSICFDAIKAAIDEGIKNIT